MGKMRTAEHSVGKHVYIKLNIVSKNCNKTANINVKKLNSLKQCLTATRPTSHN